MRAANPGEFFGWRGDAACLWPRWIVLRGVGIIYILVFAGLITQGGVLIGPGGIAPISDFAASLAGHHPNPVAAFFRAPGLFWLGTGPAMIAMLEWAGLAAAVAVVLNLWPRMALFGCWLIFLSFITADLGHFFALTQPDPMMIEVALLCIPFAPAGLRPGLGADSPPRPIAIFAVRWLLFRVMFEAGLSKFVFGGPRWRDLTAMDVMYENSPFPTILGYFDFQLPHAYHVMEIAFTFAAEVAAPLMAVFGRGRWRWLAFAIWVAFQAGIELTNNFGWLNVASIVLGVLLLDDRMIAAAAGRLGLGKLSRFLAPPAAKPRAIGPWPLWGLRAALGMQFCLTLYSFTTTCGVPMSDIPGFISGPANFIFSEFRSANGYFLFSNLKATRYDIEYEGSNDGGETWRSYEFRYLPQRENEICRFIAPWYPRFEASFQNTTVVEPQSSLFPAVAAHLLTRDPNVMSLFRGDPFPDRPPTMIRLAIYRLSFTDLGTRARTGNYWRKEYEGEAMPMIYLNERGQVAGGN